MRRLFLLLTLVVSSVLTTTAAEGAVSCRAYCQYFDEFSGTCGYMQSCTHESERCLVETRCDRWDSFDRTCDSEGSVRRCATGRGDPRLPECRTYCQHFDDFTRECLYETSCDYYDRCVAARTCERFDEFNGECLSEQTVTTCD